MQSTIYSIFQSLINMGPTLVLCVLGIIFALVQREKAPKAAIFVIFSLAIMLILMVIRPIGFNLLVRVDREIHITLINIWSFVCGLVDLGATAGLIYAVFCDRETTPGAPDPFAIKPPSAVPSGNPYVSPSPLPPFGTPPQPPQ